MTETTTVRVYGDIPDSRIGGGQMTRIVYTLPPREAVIAAYAQIGQNDWATWTYEENYGHLAEETATHWRCGMYSAPKTAGPDS